ncbi:MAG: hypothetical protein HY335_09250 [Deinococcus sp.]|nr:hypothetical protein [Deinococcus sp.]
MGKRGVMAALATLVVIAGGALTLSWGVLAMQDTSTPADSAETALLNQGRLIFEETAGGVGCASCHGHFALGDRGIAPNIRGASEERIRNALNTVQNMDFLNLVDEEIRAVAAFVGGLGALVPAKTVIQRAAVQTTELTVPAGKEIQLIFENIDRTRDYTINSEAIGIEALLVPARKAVDYVWTAPEDGGTFTVTCANCSEAGAQLTITVTQE